MDYFRLFVDNIYKLSPEVFEQFKSLVVAKKFNKKHKVVSIGTTPKHFYILTSGVSRAYTIDNKGNERIRTLFTPISTFGCLTSLITKKPSKHIYDCITDCEMYEVDYNKFIELTEKSHEAALFLAKVHELIFLKIIKRINELAVLSATERYLKLKQEIPNIDNLIQQYHIASYLNITPVQLSRIRKSLLTN
ncbi:MAG: Crp/Fnr family transcriptional regulator [Flavobacteriaceae bacterium]|nr:Crp/Fnr family transcriptional regulator [Flavobacteriaceae bacterium]